MKWLIENRQISKWNAMYVIGSELDESRALFLMLLSDWCTSMILAKKTQLNEVILLGKIA
jgi:hypothetical protein